MNKINFALIIICIFCFSWNATGQKSKAPKNAKKTEVIPLDKTKLPSGITKGATVEGISEYFLQNGLQVLLNPDPSKQTITVNITYKVGSRHEAYGETGMAHLLEHMVFKGTPKHPDIPSELTSHGARPNGTTWYDRTNYFETFSASDENLKWALDLEADRMINSFIAKKDLDKEMTVVRNEFESGENNPFRILNERVLSTSYLWHNYGKSTIGARADIENVPIERLQAFYKKYYQPDNAVLMVSGKIDVLKTLWLIDEYFSGIPKPSRIIYPTYTAEPTQDGERSVSLRRTGDIQIAAACYHIPSGAHQDAAAADLILSILTNEPSGRLYKALVETKKASDVSGYTLALKEPGFAYLATEIRIDKSFDEANLIFLKTLDDLATIPITKEELERARNKKLKNIELMLRNTEQVGTVMSEYIGMGDWRMIFICRDYVRKLTVEDLYRVAITYFKPSNRTLGRFIPEAKPDRSEISPTPDLVSLVKDYKGDAAIEQGEEFDPSPKNIESRTTRKQFKNGMKYAFIPKKTKGNVVNANLTFRMGDVNSLKGKQTISEFTASMLDQGTKTKTKQQIIDEIDRLKAKVSIGGGGSNVSVNIQTTRDNLAEVITMVADILKNPSFNSAEFEELKESVLAEYEQDKNDPRSICDKTLNKHLYQYPKDDIRYIKSIDEEINSAKEIKLEDCKSFYEMFYGADNATMSIVGDFDEKKIEPILESHFGNWKSKMPFQHIPEPFVSAVAMNQNIETPDKANGVFMAGMNLEIRDDDEDYPAMVMANFILGGGFLNSRLATRIRQKEGLSYGVGSQFSANAKDRSGRFFAFAIYAPENRNKLELAFKEEIEKFVKEGINQKELNDGKTGLLQSRSMNRAQDPMLSGSLNQLLYLDRDFKFIENIEIKINDLTVEKVNEAIKKYIDYNKLSFVKGGDFANKLKNP